MLGFEMINTTNSSKQS